MNRPEQPIQPIIDIYDLDSVNSLAMEGSKLTALGYTLLHNEHPINGDSNKALTDKRNDCLEQEFNLVVLQTRGTIELWGRKAKNEPSPAESVAA
jgi:hypothetical protein